jgi:phenylpropionate dioxygenase-like ring-hydroxylating dioxygenase large terminal subunit
VRAYPVIERDGILWLWPGEPDHADPARVPDFSFAPDTPASKTVRGYTLVQANYQYGVDNLMDLSHIEFVHKGTFAGAGVIFAGAHRAYEVGDALRSDWWMPNIPTPSMAAHAYPPDARMDHWLEMRWDAPASMRLDVGATLAGAPRAAGINIPQAHILTPADQRSSHYFWATSRTDMLNAPDFDAMLQHMFQQAFDDEDKPIIEAAFANVENEAWVDHPVSLGIDAGAMRARRKLHSLMAAEAAAG